MPRPTTYAKHAGRKAAKAPDQLMLDCETAWHENVMVEFRAWMDTRRAAGRKTLRIEEFREVAKHPPPKCQGWAFVALRAQREGLIQRIRYVPSKSKTRPRNPVMLYRIASPSPISAT